MTESQSVPVAERERIAAVGAYVLGIVPVLLNLDPFVHFIGTVLSERRADAFTLGALIAIVLLWFKAQAQDRGYTRAHIMQMSLVVLVAAVLGWLAPGDNALGAGMVPALAIALVVAFMLWLAWTAWAGQPPSLPLLGARARRWGGYERREKT